MEADGWARPSEQALGASDSPDVLYFYLENVENGSRRCRQCKCVVFFIFCFLGSELLTSVLSRFIYASTTSTTVRRAHLARHHRAEYLAAVDAHGWENGLPGGELDTLRKQQMYAEGRIPFTQDNFLFQLAKVVVTNDLVSDFE